MPRRHMQHPRGPRRQTNWFASVVNTDHSTLAADTTLLDQVFTGFSEVNTVTRIRGLLSVATDQNAANETPFGAIGFGIVTAEAVAAGVGSIPGPYSNANWDGWLLHQYFSTIAKVGDATGFTIVSQQYELDSKAMRKLKPEDRLVVMVENGNATDGLIFTLDFRVLFKES